MFFDSVQAIWRIQQHHRRTLTHHGRPSRSLISRSSFSVITPFVPFAPTAVSLALPFALAMSADMAFEAGSSTSMSSFDIVFGLPDLQMDTQLMSCNVQRKPTRRSIDATSGAPIHNWIIGPVTRAYFRTLSHSVGQLINMNCDDEGRRRRRRRCY